MSKLYHREVYWKNGFDLQTWELIRTVERLSSHLYDHIENDKQERYNIDVKKLFLIIQRIKNKGFLDSDYIFEVETDDDYNVVKSVIRCDYNECKDIIIVVRDGFIVTSWLCNKNDNHSTLDIAPYEKN